MNCSFASIKIALDKDRAAKGKKVKKGGKKARRTGKKGKKKKEKDLTPDRTTESLFEELVVNGILVKYPEFYMKQYLGDRAYAARQPTNPAPGDLRQVIKEYCILPLGSEIIRNFAPCIKSVLIAGELILKLTERKLNQTLVSRPEGNWQTVVGSCDCHRNWRYYVRSQSRKSRRQISRQNRIDYANAFGSESIASAAACRALLRRRREAFHEEDSKNGPNWSEAIKKGPPEDCEEHRTGR